MTRSRSQKLNTVSRCIAARLLGIRQPITRVAAPCFEQRLGHLEHRLAAGALAHADQHHALADRHHVAAFQRRRAEGLVGVAHQILKPAFESRVER